MDTIYVRTLKNADHTVFCVEDGQKTYYDPKFGRRVPYSSGQQIKRSVLDSLNRHLNSAGSPTTFLWDVSQKGELPDATVYGICDPTYADQLIGGWMKAVKGGGERTLKRRSPISFSAMRGLHPFLASTDSENITFDRSDRTNNNIIVRDAKGNELSDEDVIEVLEGKDRSLRRKWIPNNSRASGLFVQDTAIDLRRLFSVTLNPYEPEIADETEAKLREAGWKESENIFGPCLVAPKEVREKWIHAFADAIINWQITSNQARTFSLMETLAVAISDKPQNISTAIRAKLTEDEKAKPIIEEELEGVSTFVTPSAGAFMPTLTESASALDEAKGKLVEMMTSFDYENQQVGV